jgi:hypothetical protein
MTRGFVEKANTLCTYSMMKSINEEQLHVLFEQRDRNNTEFYDMKSLWKLLIDAF